MRISLRIWALVVALLLLAAACGDEGTTSQGVTDEAGDDVVADGCDPLPTSEPGRLTVATGDVQYEPWMKDSPDTQEGFESALVYALLDELGLGDDDIEWVSTDFNEAIAPGPKPYDFNVQQYSITEERDEVVDFSIGYYQVEQALVALPDAPISEAGSLEELRSYKLGAAIGSTSLDYIEDHIQPESQAAVYNDNAAAKAAFDAGQVDGLVFDLPTAYYITAVEIPEGSIVGVLPRLGDDPEELGFLFEDGDPLVPCINEALERMHADGTIEALEDEWLSLGGDIPTLDR